MSYIDKNLAPGETLVYKTGCHWIVMFWPFLGAVVLGFVGFALFVGGLLATRRGSSYQGAIVEGGIALVAAVALIAGGIIRRAATEVAVSNKRVLIKRACSRGEPSKCCCRKLRVSALMSLSWGGFSATER